MSVIPSSLWGACTQSRVSIIATHARYEWVAHLLNSAVAEEIEHARRREKEPATLLSDYDKSYTREYTEYTRDNPMYDMTDYSAYVP